MKKIVNIQDVSFGYNEKLVLKNIRLDIWKGDYLGLVGPNGSAKSTLIKLILGLLKPQKGSIRLFGTDINKFKDWKKIGYIAQNAHAVNTGFPGTVEEIISANLYSQIGLFHPIRKKHKEEVDTVLRFVGMDGYKKRLIGNLSGGQQQKVMIARTLISKPEIIFLDEPTVGIDIKSQVEFYDLLQELNENMNMTIIMVSHDIGVITEKVNRIACLGEGNLFIHDQNSQIPFSTFISKVYGEKMNFLIHHHG